MSTKIMHRGRKIKEVWGCGVENGSTKAELGER